MYLAATDNGNPLVGLLILVIALGLYFLPAIVAIRRHHQDGMVFVLNLFLGWTLIGWVVAMAIAVGSESKPVIQPAPQVAAPIMSPDGQSWWDGYKWQPLATPRKALYKPPQD
jgi:hypothetical protein